MTTSRRWWRVLRSPLSIVLGAASVVPVNLFGSWLATTMTLPPGGDGRLGWDLAWFAASGVVAAWLVAKFAPCAPRRHAIVLGMLALAIDAYALMQMGDDWPRWFSAGIVLSLPLQIWLGAAWALRARGTRRQPGAE